MTKPYRKKQQILICERNHIQFVLMDFKALYGAISRLLDNGDRYSLSFLLNGNRRTLLNGLIRSACVVVTGLVIFFSFYSSTVNASNRMSVPAEFVRKIQVPGKSNQIKRPSAIFVDRQFNELFVADPGHNRIAIFDSNGVFQHEFGGGNHFSSPVDLAVDREGYIWVLGTHKDGRDIFVFDFDGRYLRRAGIPPVIDEIPTSIGSIDLDDNDRVYALDGTGFRILVFENSGSLIDTISLLTQMDQDTRAQQVLGKIRVIDNKILIPSGSMGTVLILDLDGNEIGRFGHKGNEPGQLNFPVAVTRTIDNTYLVLDKHRFNIVCYDSAGVFKGEFGGKGVNPGWFYHPSVFDVDNCNITYIGQVFNSVVQACRIPEFICPSEPGGNKE